MSLGAETTDLLESRARKLGRGRCESCRHWSHASYTHRFSPVGTKTPIRLSSNWFLSEGDFRPDPSVSFLAWRRRLHLGERLLLPHAGF